MRSRRERSNTHLRFGSVRFGSIRPIRRLHFTISSPLRNRISNSRSMPKSPFRLPFNHFVADLPHFWSPWLLYYRASDGTLLGSRKLVTCCRRGRRRKGALGSKKVRVFQQACRHSIKVYSILMWFLKAFTRLYALGHRFLEGGIVLWPYPCLWHTTSDLA